MEENNQQQTDKITFADINSEKYNKYKSGITRYLKFNLLYAAIAVVAAVLILFLPIFSINLSKLSTEELDAVISIPGVEEEVYNYFFQALSGETVSDCKFSYSIIDEVQYLGKYVLNLSDGDIVVMSYVFLSFMCTFLLAVTIIAGIFSFGFSIYSLSNIDGYAKNYYDKFSKEIISSQYKVKRYWFNKRTSLASPWEWLSLGIFWEVIGFIIGKFASGTIYDGSEYIAASCSYYVTGVTLWMAIAVIIFVATGYLKHYSKKIKVQAVTDAINEDVVVELPD
ncbi:MAG: hypothetical protein LUD19_00250 [Clostridia bacterium]|nr:hypothetical protein [Clostridia bacterium]